MDEGVLEVPRLAVFGTEFLSASAEARVLECLLHLAKKWNQSFAVSTITSMLRKNVARPIDKSWRPRSLPIDLREDIRFAE